MKRAKENSEGWLITLEGRILIPEKTALGLVRLVHNITHLGKTSLQRLTQIPVHSPIGNFNSASKACLHCAQHNTGQGPKPSLLSQKKGVYPFQHFTEIQPSKTFWWFLVVVCTFRLGRGISHPHGKGHRVLRVLAKEIIPWFRVPSSIRSDNGPVFISQVVKLTLT
jgi:hypothetical protein